MLKAIVFDFDGVVVDSEPLHFQAMLEVSKPLGADFDYDRYLTRLVGFDDRDAFRTILFDLGREVDETLVAAMCQQKQTAFENLVNKGIDAIPGSIELIDEAATQIPIAIASGATMADIDLILTSLKRRNSFGAIVTADQVAKSKPHPQSYLLACERIGVEPAEALAIEDTAAGIRSARDAGLMALGLSTTGPADRLHEAHRVVENLAGVTVDVLREWFD